MCGSSLWFHWSICLFSMPRLCCFTLWYDVISGMVRPPAVLLLFRTVLVILGSLFFYMKPRSFQDLWRVVLGFGKDCIDFVECFWMTVFFALQKLFSFMKSHLSIVDLKVWAIGVLFRKLSPVPCVQGYFPLSLLLHLVYPVLCWSPWSTWTWVLCRVKNMDIFCILLHADIQWDQHNLLKMLSFFYCMILASLLKIKCPYVCGFISRSSILFH